MPDIKVEADIGNLPSLQKLVARRARMIWSLSGVLLLVLAGNLYLMSGGAELGGQTFGKDGVITLVVAYSVFVIFFGAGCAGFYVWWANKNLDPLIEDVKRDISRQQGGAS